MWQHTRTTEIWELVRVTISNAISQHGFRIAVRDTRQTVETVEVTQTSDVTQVGETTEVFKVLEMKKVEDVRRYYGKL